MFGLEGKGTKLGAACISECMICPKNDVLLFLASYCPQSMYGIWSVARWADWVD